MIALFVEIIFFASFIFIVCFRTNEDFARRWKASVFIGMLSGICTHLIFTLLLIIGWIYRGGFTTLQNGVNEIIGQCVLLFVDTAAYFTMPVMILATLIAYFNFWQTGDRLIEKYWRNPKIRYRANQKPPYLKF
jgi:hypothetical protein